jgi:hypothetical protein
MKHDAEETIDTHTGAQYEGEDRNESSIIDNQPKETLYLSYRRWWLPIQHILYLAGVSRDPRTILHQSRTRTC